VVKKAPHLGSGSEKQQQNPSHLLTARLTQQRHWGGTGVPDSIMSFTSPSRSLVHPLNTAIEVERVCQIQSSTADLDMIAYSSHPMTSVTPISMWRLVLSASLKPPPLPLACHSTFRLFYDLRHPNHRTFRPGPCAIYLIC
jgi:hypothetical protein